MAVFPEWHRFLQLQSKQRPLAFAYGVSHSVEPGFYCPSHSHQALEMVFHPTGTGTTIINRRHQVKFEEGSVVVYAPGQDHDQRVKTKGEDLCIQIISNRPNPPFPRQHLYVPAFNDPGFAEDIRILAQGNAPLSPAEQAVFNFRATASLLAVVHQACSLLEQSSVSLAEKYVLEAERYVRLHFIEIKFLADVARAIGIGPDHLRHLFRERRGRSLVGYVNELRINRGKTLLVHTRLPIKQIATLCGFKDEYYFSSLFRRMVDIPPRHYRTRYWQSANVREPDFPDNVAPLKKGRSHQPQNNNPKHRYRQD